ncbi:MAG: chromate transporter [Clostridia bacterium]|nr:chromate transporter [Clostridia bacterium]
MSKIKDLAKLFFAFFKVGILTFGGGYAMLPMLEREIADKHKWATVEEMMDYFAISQCTPGVIAVNLATFIGRKTNGIIGGIVATLGVVTPSVIIISLVATILQKVYDNPFVKSAFLGIGVAVCAILVQAFLKISKTGVIDKVTFCIAAAAFVLSIFFGVSTILIIVAAGVFGIVYMWAKEKSDRKTGDMK